jgi:putative ATP-dependent endonuclease of OLD family
MHNTIDAVTRIFQKNQCSNHASIHAATTLPNKAHLVRMINSHNNERLFFADHVVLVEGIMDRLVFENLIRFIGDRYNRRTTIEVVEVHGKRNFDQYKRVLDIVRMPTSIVADQDYILDIGTEKIKNLFVSDYDGIDRSILLDKKSRDTKTLIEAIEEANDSKNFSNVADIIGYIKNRRTRLKDEITEEEDIDISNFITEKRCHGIYILEMGEIEDYLPNGITSPGKLIKLLEDPNWMQQLKQESRSELLNIITTILELSEENRMAIHAEFQAEESV